MSEEISSGIIVRFEDAEVVLTIAQGIDGQKGESAYESAVRGGYQGTEEDFIQTLNQIRATPVVQETGQSTEAVMSQKAVTDWITGSIHSNQISRIEVVSEFPDQEEKDVLYIKI